MEIIPISGSCLLLILSLAGIDGTAGFAKRHMAPLQVFGIPRGPSSWYARWLKKGKVMLIKIAKKSSTFFFESSHEKKKVKAVAFFRHLKKNTKSSYRAYGQRSLLGSKQHLVAEWKKHKHFGCE